MSLDPIPSNQLSVHTEQEKTELATPSSPLIHVFQTSLPRVDQEPPIDLLDNVTFEEDLPLVPQIFQRIDETRVKVSFPNGSYYIGEWSNDEPNGEGEMHFPDVESYVGGWLDGKKHGFGTHTAKNAKYVGQWKNGLFHGRCVSYSIQEGNSRVVYKGEMFEGSPHGQGEMSKFTPQGAIIQKGKFIKGVPEGQFEITYLTKGKRDNFVGQIRKGVRHGHGVYTFANGKKYEGNFFEGDMSGKGILRDVNGQETQIYEGEFEKNKKHGKGKLVHSTGEIYEGYFHNNMYHGVGELVHREGYKMKAIFVNDKPTGKVLFSIPNSQAFEGTYDLNGNPISRRLITPKEKKALEELIEKQAPTTSSPKEETTLVKEKTGSASKDELDKIYRFIEGDEKKKDKKKSPTKLTEIKPQESRASSSSSSDASRNKSADLESDLPSLSEDEGEDAIDEKNQFSNVQKKISALISEGRHLIRPEARVLRWRREDVLETMEQFEDQHQFKYRNMSLSKKREMIIFHDAGSMLDPIIFHPSMKEKYIYETSTGIGCYVEIIKDDGKSYQGVIQYGLDERRCYHRMFEPRSKLDFLSLSMNEFFDTKQESKSPLESDPFYETLAENQLFYEDSLYEMDENSGIFSIHDTRKNIQATVKIYPLRMIEGKFSRSTFRNNFLTCVGSSLEA